MRMIGCFFSGENPLSHLEVAVRTDLKLALIYYRYAAFVFSMSVILLLAALFVSCSGQPQQPPAQMPPAHEAASDQPFHGQQGMPQMPPMGEQTAQNVDPRTVVEPEDVRKTYSAVSIEVKLAQSGESIAKLDIPIGGSAKVETADPNLTIEVLHFLPSFLMTDGSITSVDNNLINPAAKVKITGEQDWEGWLFGTMPDVHPYPGPKYLVLLTGAVPIEQNEPQG